VAISLIEKINIMKTKLTFIALLIVTIATAQSINYKAIIKDDNGNVLANTDIDVQFLIESIGLPLYREVHNTQTNSNGLIILNIGAGTPITGDFYDISWSSFAYTLNVQIDTGEGFVDMGTTPFRSVPFANRAFRADEAANVNGLIRKTEGNTSGWRLRYRGTNPSQGYGSIGLNAIDLSSSDANGAILVYPYGATGDYSFAAGQNTVATGNHSVVLGNSNLAIGDYSFAHGFSTFASGNGSFAVGNNTTAEGNNSMTSGTDSRANGNNALALGFETFAQGNRSAVFGSNTFARSFNSFVIGRHNVTSSSYDLDSWVGSDPLFIIGNGISISNPANAVTVLKNGNVGIGTSAPQEPLHISGRLRIGSETIEDTGNDRLSFNADLLPDVNVGMQLGNSSFRWQGLWAADGTINTSDRRDKTNIKTINYGLNEILKMNPVSFNWKNRKNQDTKLGLIAQELLKIVPEVVKTHEWQSVSEDKNAPQEKVQLERLGVYYSDLIPVLINAIKEQNKIIKSQGEALKASHTNYEALLSRIEIIEFKTSN
jgi:hypothetical protein